ncbi:hypothetical protein BDY19DRAFT_179441 [Irpex rosettiformis]|uniref:Uncharacterized protein n=1 Tax=Irpex rosettiformis TaxID=378272 RepID=A0ACB8U2S5_9APHY|nr:hypothetical protein BDY19DRAFT_179441 [Irpex rosettiformis]
MATPVHSPHPFLKEPVLYVVDPPNRLEWIHLQETFKLCGIISSDGKSAVEGKQGRRKWPIRFQNLFQAEMALATIQGAYAAQLRPPWALVLSHSPTLEKPSPSPRLFPQYLKFEENSFLDGTVTMDQLFRWFRVAGPLASVKMDVYVGNSQRTATVEYFREEHANFARMTTNGLHRKLRNRAKFSLRTYNPYSLRCSARLQGSWRQVSQLELTTIFTQFGHVTSVVTKSIEFKAYGFVTFSSQYCGRLLFFQPENRCSAHVTPQLPKPSNRLMAELVGNGCFLCVTRSRQISTSLFNFLRQPMLHLRTFHPNKTKTLRQAPRRSSSVRRLSHESVRHKKPRRKHLRRRRRN